MPTGRFRRRRRRVARVCVAFVSNDINNRFGAALRQPGTATFTMMEGRAVELETDLRLLREVGISL
jgi:hypothetical protein